MSDTRVKINDRCPQQCQFCNLLVLRLTFIANISFVQLLFSPTCYTPWSVFQDGLKELHSSGCCHPERTVSHLPSRYGDHRNSKTCLYWKSLLRVVPNKTRILPRDTSCSGEPTHCIVPATIAPSVTGEREWVFDARSRPPSSQGYLVLAGPMQTVPHCKCILLTEQAWDALFSFAALFRFALVNFTFLFLTLFSKFYFNFTSQYLFAIGLTVLFSVSSNLRAIVIFTQQSQAVLLLNPPSWIERVWRSSHETFTLCRSVFQHTWNSTHTLPREIHKLQFRASWFQLRF